MTGDGILALATAIVTALLARAAYRRGCRRAAPLLPAATVAELRAHKIACLGEPPERVALELSLLLGVAEGAGARPDETHRHAATRRGRADASA